MSKQLHHEPSPHAFLTSVFCALWPPACLCPARGDSVEASLCQRSGKGWQFSVCFNRQGVCLAEKRCLWTADIDWTKDQGPTGDGNVQCPLFPTRKKRRRPDQSKRRREGSGFATSEQTAVPPNRLGCDCATGRSWMDLSSAGHAGAMHGPQAGRKGRFLAGSRGRRRGAGQQPC